MDKYWIKQINDVASTVACAIADSTISLETMKNHLDLHLRMPSDVVEHCVTIVNKARTEIYSDK